MYFVAYVLALRLKFVCNRWYTMAPSFSITKFVIQTDALKPAQLE
jgi:hypothetical protein